MPERAPTLGAQATLPAGQVIPISGMVYLLGLKEGSRHSFHVRVHGGNVKEQQSGRGRCPKRHACLHLPRIRAQSLPDRGLEHERADTTFFRGPLGRPRVSHPGTGSGFLANGGRQPSSVSMRVGFRARGMGGGGVRRRVGATLV